MVAKASKNGARPALLVGFQVDLRKPIATGRRPSGSAATHPARKFRQQLRLALLLVSNRQTENNSGSETHHESLC
jgi:hypothetical protein